MPIRCTRQTGGRRRWEGRRDGFGACRQEKVGLKKTKLKRPIVFLSTPQGPGSDFYVVSLKSQEAKADERNREINILGSRRGLKYKGETLFE